MQTKLLMWQIKWEMRFAEEGHRFVIPILYGNGDCAALSVPTHSMHKTYLIVEKVGEAFNFYWVNRPDVSYKQFLNATDALVQIRSMLDERFPFMDIEKLLNYPVRSKEPEFSDSTLFATIDPQGSGTNCVVSNMFGMLEALDRLRGEDVEVTKLRYKIVREALQKDYGFYKNNFFPFADKSEGYSLSQIWGRFEEHPYEPI